MLSRWAAIRSEFACLAIAGLAVVSAPIAAATSPAASAHPPAATQLRLEFDYSAAELMVDAIDRPALTEAEAGALLGNRGVAAMVAKTGVYSPNSTPQAFVADMQSFVATHRYPTGDF